jgi:hypothetical protein
MKMEGSVAVEAGLDELVGDGLMGEGEVRMHGDCDGCEDMED